MRKIVVSEFISLDGVIESPENWHFPYVSDDMNAYIQEQIAAGSAALLGRKTYETFASFWPTQTNNEFGIADKLNSQPKYVVSTTLKKADWQNSTLISKNVMDEVAKLKEQPGGFIACTGSATLVRSLLKAGLVDEMQLALHPIVVGRGLRLFEDGTEPFGFKLADLKRFDGGVVNLVYQKA
ncbi:MAG: dihydrofolate reductase family protein [Anaerolineae bacterium]|nr:dihydrofolate reductase family protein [Anaerolineae bacterium]